MLNLQPHSARSRLRRQEGQSVVELAFALPMIAVLILCLVDLALGLNEQLDASQVASQAARLAAVDSPILWPANNPSNPTNPVQAYVLSQRDTNALQSATVSVCFPTNQGTGTSGQIGDPVEIKVTNNFQIAPFIPVTIPIAGTATMRLEQLPNNIPTVCP